MKKSYIKAGVLNLIFLLFFFAVFHVHYETNDDNVMAALALGAMGQRTPHLVFINSMVGTLLCGLSMVSQAVNWYTLLQVVILFVSLTGISQILIEKNQSIGLVLSAVVNAFVGYEVYVNMQFTKTAGIATIAGAILIAYALEEQFRLGHYIVGGILLLLGSCYRIDACFMVLAVMSYLGIRKLVVLFREKATAKSVARYILGWAIPLLLVIGVYAVDQLSFQRDEQWSYYMEYNPLRSNLVDYGFPEYEQNAGLYNELNITEEDVSFYRNEYFGDVDILNASAMRQLVESKPKNTMSVSRLIQFAREMGSKLFGEAFVIAFLLCGLVLSCSGTRSRLAFLWGLVVVMGIELYLFYIGRSMRHRIEVILWSAALCLLLYEFETVAYKLSCRQVVAGIMIVFVLSANVYADAFFNPMLSGKSRQEAIRQVDADDEHLYIFSALNCDYVYGAYDALDAYPYGIWDNIAFWGTWETELPIKKAVLSRYGIENIYRDIIDNENVYIVSTGDEEDILGYIQRHYCETASLTYSGELYGLELYQVETKK